MVQIGETVSDFTLEGTQGDEIRKFTLSDFADGRPTMLVFYVHDFSPVCSTQMCEVNDMEVLTFNDDVAVLGISTDGPYSHQQFIDQNQISYPLLSDVDKNVYQQFDLVEETEDSNHQTKRGVILLDDDMKVRYQWVAEDNWNEWNMEPLHEAYEIVEELTEAPNL